MISDIKVHTATHLDDAYSWLAEYGDKGKVLAGGTDLMVYLNAKSFIAPAYLDIWRLNELRFVREDGDFIVLGAMSTYTDIIESPVIRQYAPILVDAAKTVGAAQIQNRGTIGGNIVNASPAGDTLPVFAVFDAELEIGSSRGTRTVPFNEFYTGYRKTVLKPDELLLSVRLNKKNFLNHQSFRKVGTRRAQAISKVVIAINSTTQSGKIDSIKIGIGSVAPTVIRASKTESFLLDQTINQASLSEASKLLKDDISPIDDIRSTARYRTTVASNILRRILMNLAEESR
ncbi:MAG TPA: xanthine dehydrogenase family protein subunit M [Blastocatellia bacterium]|nr:xanthine dehydrogenase family protein subunit M [Blastocatellia bacterium]